MTATLTPLREPAAPSRARAAVGITVAVVVVTAAVVTVALVGYVPLPAMSSLADHPDPRIPGTVAYVHGDGDRACLAIVPAGGGDPFDLRCGLSTPEALAWTSDGDLAVWGWGGEGRYEVPGLTVVDAVTGEPREHVDGEAPLSWAADRRIRADGAQLLVDPSSDGTAELWLRQPEGDEVRLLRLEGPRDYGIASAQWSPDGAWVLATDTRGRLFLVAADGDPGPRLLAELGGRDAPWTLPAWWMDDVPAQRVGVDTASGEEA